MNNVDQVVGYADIASGDYDAAIWSGGKPSVINIPGFVGAPISASAMAT